MRDLRDLTRKSYREAVTLPDFVGERCVHTLIERASCQACVDACPQNAWVLNDELLGIDPSLCDGCDICVAACPQGAIQAPLKPGLRDDDGESLALLTCEPSGVPTAAGEVPCLHAIGLNALVSLYRDGVRSLVCCCADCDACPRGEAPRLDVLVENFNALLRNRRLPEMQYRSVPTTEWSDSRTNRPPVPAGGAINRRQFLQRAAQAVIEGKTRLGTMETPESARFEPAGRILSSRSPTQMVPFLPHIEPTRCNACSACLKLCPHTAISFENNFVAYCIEPDRCSGCGICVDVCDQDAISVQAWAIPELTRIPLTYGYCDHCGVPYVATAANPSRNKLCRICNQRRHPQLLYQVLD